MKAMKPFAEKLGPLFISGDMAINRLSPTGDHVNECSTPVPSPMTPAAAWFDVRVLYLRVSSSPCIEAPEFLSIRFPPRSISTALEVNGGRVAPSEEAALILRRDRVDKESKEVTYISTENLRISGGVSFEVSHRDDLLLRGTLSHSNSCTDLLVQDDVDSPSGCSQLGWSMECTCSIESFGGCVFLKSKYDFQPGAAPPAMEVCVVGHYCGRPVILDQSVTLTVRRRSMRRRLSNLNVILEEDEVAKAAADEPPSSPAKRPPLRDVGDKSLYAPLQDKALESLESFYAAGNADSGYSDNDDAEMSWFNAGVRIGVGVGMGMCLGVGIGVGLLFRTYQATSKSFRKGLL